MPKTKVVNITKTKDFDVYIGRAGQGHDGYFGNPFRDEGRAKSIKLFKDYALRKIKTDPEYKERIRELHGKTLGCFCKPRDCHGDVLAEIADRLAMEESIFD